MLAGARPRVNGVGDFKLRIDRRGRTFMQTSVTVLNSERARSLLDKDARVSAQSRQGAGARAPFLPGPGPPGLKPALHCFNLFLFLSFFLFLFYFSDICFDLIKILNHFITLCQFLQELDILFQSSPTGGIIFGHILIYITNIFPMQIFMH